MDAAERALLAETVRAAITDVPDGDGVLADLGWLDMLRAERAVAVDIVFHALGCTNAAATVLDDVLVHALGLEPRSELAALLPPFTARTAPGRVDGDRVRADGIATARVVTADAIVVACGDSQAATVPVAATALTAIGGIDPDARMYVVHVDAAAADAIPIDTASWDAAAALAQRAVAHQIAGASQAMLDLARTHAVERVQFGRPIARFQAVRHRLADALVAIEALDSALMAAADEPNPETAALAKAIAGRTARTVAGHCQQVLAGIGFTTDHPFHRFLKRTMLLDGLFGAADDLVLDIGRRLLATRHVPTLIEL